MNGVRFTNNDYVVMKIDITLFFAKKFGISIDDTITLFESNGIYDYLDSGGEEFITKSYPYMVSFLARKLGMVRS